MRKHALLMAQFVGLAIGLAGCDGSDSREQTPRRGDPALSLKANEAARNDLGIYGWEVYRNGDTTFVLGLDAKGALVYEQRVLATMQAGQKMTEVEVIRPARKHFRAFEDGRVETLADAKDARLDRMLQHMQADFSKQKPSGAEYGPCLSCATSTTTCVASTAACASCPTNGLGCFACPVMVTSCFAAGYYCACCYDGATSC